MLKYLVPPEDVATTAQEIVRLDLDGAVDDVCLEMPTATRFRS